MEGLLDMIAFGNMVEFATALDQSTYNDDNISPEEYEEQETTTARYRMFIRWFGQRFVLMIGLQWVNPSYLFQKSLVDFATTVYGYVIQEEPNLDHTTHLTPLALKKRLLLHISMHWQELTPYFEQ